MYAIVSATIRERSTASPSSPISSKADDIPVQDVQQERAPAPSRFAAAQQLFRRQQTVPPKPPSPPFIPPIPISPTRHRSFTASSSLYSKLEQSIQAETTSPQERVRAVSSPESMSFTESFGQPRPQHIIQPSGLAPPSSRPQTPINPTCILPGPKYTKRPFDITAIKGTTAAGKAAWWCRHDRLVVFDGLKPEQEDYTEKNWKRLLVRTSKGLEMSRKNCPKEVIRVDIPCGHCRDALGMQSWMYEAKIKKSRICEGCQAKCWEEVEKEKVEIAARVENEDNRRDSFLMQVDEKGLRRIQSEKNLRGDVKVNAAKMKDLTFVEATPDLRKVRSDWQLPRTTTCVNEILHKHRPPPPT